LSYTIIGGIVGLLGFVISFLGFAKGKIVGFSLGTVPLMFGFGVISSFSSSNFTEKILKEPSHILAGWV
jgi:sulfite exporter TauE/SafE